MKRVSKTGIKALKVKIRAMHYAMETAYYAGPEAVKKLKAELATAYKTLDTMEILLATAA